MFFFLNVQDAMALAYDAGKVISKAVNSASCSSINSSAVTSQDTDAIYIKLHKTGES